ncbi:MAG: tetratricopeptide repeat protein, partial [Thermoplasmata archaeon]|nr:tetratricopeptide repeat protein [Thermoplasmata archaeon]
MTKLFVAVVLIALSVGLASSQAAEQKAVSDPAAEEAAEDPAEVAADHYMAGEWRDAARIYRGLVSRGAADPIALFRLGDCLRRLGEPREAIVYLRQAAEILDDLRPIPGEAWLSRYYLAELYLEGKLYEKAQWEVDLALAMTPHNVRLLRLYGDVLCGQESYDAALEKYMRALEIEPQNIRLLIGASRTLVLLGRFKEAYETAQRAREIEPGNLEVAEILGQVCFSLGRFEQALAEYQFIIRNDAATPQILLNVASIY